MKHTRRTITATANSGFQKLAIQGLYENLFFVSSFVLQTVFCSEIANF